jgi:transcription initiation factor TFIID subunit 11
MSGSDQSSMSSQQQQHQQYYGSQDGSQSQMGFMPMQMEGNSYPSNSMPFSTPSTSQSQQPPPASNSSDISAFSAIHTPIDFGDMGGGMAIQQNMMNNTNYLAPPSQQQQRYNPALDFSGQSSGFQSPMYMTTPGITDGSAGVSGTSTPLAGDNANKPTTTSKGSGKPRAPKKPKLKVTEGNSTQEQEQQSVNANGESSADSKTTKKQTKRSKDPNEPPKQSKPRKRKSIGPEGAENASSPAVGTPQSVTGENDADGRPTTSNRGRGGTSRGRGGRGRGGLSGANSRRTSQADGLAGLSGDISMQDDDFSRAGSLAPGTGESTPTKRGAKGGRGVGRGRGGGRRRGTATSRGSRATSGRATASVAPGQENGTVAPDDGILGERIEGDEDGEEGAGEIDEEEDEEDDEGFDLGLEEDELDLQEAIQKKRAINMGPLMKAMTEEQQDRYSAFRRHFLDKRFVKRLLQHLTRQTVTPQIVTLVAGVGKVFVGQIVEKAREVRQERLTASANGIPQPHINHRQSIRPDHLAEALRRYREEREVPGHFAPGTPNPGAGVSGNGKRRRMF